ncbi:proline--tRNA ligase [Candidatus Woesearchaeota archaeon]|nr:proline--tRNA ligase [Candidatus Woesearchaeota archaeon]
MAHEKSIGITVKKADDMPEWYGQVVVKSGLADYAPVKGCMVIRPYGYAIWQRIMDYFNGRMGKLGVENAYFPLFIPESFFKKEAEHAKGFEPEVAWVMNRDESQEKLALRPTSETIMYDSYSRWVRSWRDLPLRINQWCNIIRWEVSDVKLFLRSREFLWQEGHCVYESEKECDRETIMMLDEYEKLCHELLAVPVLKGKKTEKEKFAGAHYTTTIEAFMPDGKALQCGTSHNLGQGFSKAFNISFLGKDGKMQTPWQSSWGFSTRLIGALVMQHSDDKGLVLPPSIAPYQAVIIPIIFEDSREKVLKKAIEIRHKLKDMRVFLDDRDQYTSGWKFNEWELKGVPLRIEIGPKDVEKDQVILVRRDTGKKEPVKIADLNEKAAELLETVQSDLFKKAQKFLKDSIVEVKSWKEFEKTIKSKKIAKALFCGGVDCEDNIKAKTEGANSRCIPFEQKNVKGKCVHCGEEARFWTYFSRSY